MNKLFKKLKSNFFFSRQTKSPAKSKILLVLKSDSRNFFSSQKKLSESEKEKLISLQVCFLAQVLTFNISNPLIWKSNEAPVSMFDERGANIRPNSKILTDDANADLIGNFDHLTLRRFVN